MHLQASVENMEATKNSISGHSQNVQTSQLKEGKEGGKKGGRKERKGRKRGREGRRKEEKKEEKKEEEANLGRSIFDANGYFHLRIAWPLY